MVDLIKHNNDPKFPILVISASGLELHDSQHESSRVSVRERQCEVVRGSVSASVRTYECMCARDKGEKQEKNGPRRNTQG